MSDNFSINKLLSSFEGKDLSALKKQDGDIKSINDVSLFSNQDGKINEELLTKEGFVSNLYDGNTSVDDAEKVSKEQLGELYDILGSMAPDGKVSENELRLLASLGEGGKENIDKTDLQAVLGATEQINGTQAAQDGTQQVQDNIQAAPVSQIKQDENGNNYVEVNAWGGGANDCLEAIIQNNYDLEGMGIEYGSEAYNTLEKAVMDANPNIYGTEESGWRNEVGGNGRRNAVLYEGEKIILPGSLPGGNETAASSTSTTVNDTQNQNPNVHYEPHHNSYINDNRTYNYFYGSNGNENSHNDDLRWNPNWRFKGNGDKNGGTPPTSPSETPPPSKPKINTDPDAQRERIKNQIKKSIELDPNFIRRGIPEQENEHKDSGGSFEKPSPSSGKPAWVPAYGAGGYDALHEDAANLNNPDKTLSPLESLNKFGTPNGRPVNGYAPGGLSQDDINNILKNKIKPNEDNTV